METHLVDWFRNTPDGKDAEEILRACVHCGFCTATCPTYQLLGDENDGPRGSFKEKIREIGFHIGRKGNEGFRGRRQDRSLQRRDGKDRIEFQAAPRGHLLILLLGRRPGRHLARSGPEIPPGPREAPADRPQCVH